MLLLVADISLLTPINTFTNEKRKEGFESHSYVLFYKNVLCLMRAFETILLPHKNNRISVEKAHIFHNAESWLGLNLKLKKDERKCNAIIAGES